MYINDLSKIIDLTGVWQFAMGQRAAWESIQVPGCWEMQGLSMYTEGPAYYRRRVTLPANWENHRILLVCEAVSYACRVFCNGMEVGSHLGLWTPFTVDLTSAALPGQENLIELEIYKPGDRYPTRSSLAGFLPDVATTFGGIWQPICLRAVTCALTDLLVRAEYETRSIHVQATVETFGSALIQPVWKITISHNDCLLREEVLPLTPEGTLEAKLPLPEALPWSPDTPALYDVQITLLSDGHPVAQGTRRTGFRQLSVQGSQILFNDQPLMVRGILSWGWEPDRIAPTYTLEQARAEIRKAREMGFNLIKLCLVVPNPAYFDVADEEGMLLWEELPMWLPEVNDQLRAQAPKEYREITQLLIQHPSVVLYSLGCELNQSVDGTLLGQMNDAVRQTVQGDVLVCDNSGSGESYGGLDIDFADFTDYHPYYDLQFFEPLLDNWRRDWQAPRPWIFGEFCDSDTFRDLTEIILANGGTRPWWLTRDNPVTTWRTEPKAVLEWEKRLESANPGFPLQKIVEVSYQQSYTIRKYTLETLRRRRGMGGYIITGLRDTPISTSGVWDDFGRPKWSGEALLRINGEAILALDVVRRRQWQNGGDRPDRVDVYNHWAGDPARWYVILHDTGAGFAAGSKLHWTLQDADENTLASNTAQLEDASQLGIPQQVGLIQVQLPAVTRAVQLRLDVQLVGDRRTVYNSWPIWVHPRPAAFPENLALYDPSGQLVDFSDRLNALPRLATDRPFNESQFLITTNLSPAIWQAIADGTRVLLLQQGEGPLPVRRCPFWREAIKLFPEHPIWEEFPHQGFSDLQFFGLASDLAFDTPRLTETLPSGACVRPILRRLDAREFHIAEYLFEAQVGRGILLGCALRLQGGMGAQPYGLNRNVAGGAMFHALLHYLIQSVETENR